jgi:asparagine synthase (glutamine-hydrolysing)
MCGITGVALTSGAIRPPLESMYVTLSHRGPDDRGLYWSDDGLVGLAQCRLAVIDLSAAAHQPMSDASKRIWITFNGEIYNFRDLRHELEGRGHRFTSHSDTEVVIEAYREWGDAFLTRLEGMFALALYDSAQRRLLLARDRAGEKPLFYFHGGGALLFASELKAFTADPAFPRVIDPLALEFYLTYGYVPGEMCIFRGTGKLAPGHALSFDLDGGTMRTWAYWSLPEPPRVCEDGEVLLDELDRLLEQSVRRQLVADVPVGVLLSGGVDSSLVTAMAARVSPRTVKTFTISFPGFSGHDEAPFARLVAEHFGTEHVELAAEPATVELLPLLARQYDEPIADHSMVPTYLVSKLVRREATVALGGDGGDELFGGYHHYQWVLREERLRRYVARPIRRVAGAIASGLLPVGTRGRNHIIGLSHDTGYSIAHINVYFDRRTRQALLRGLGTSVDGAPERYRAGLTNPGYSPIRRATEADFRTTMVDGYLVKVDRASMLNSLEIRAPFLDVPLIEFAFSRVPDDLKVTEQERKILLRRLGSRLLPPQLDLKRKQGFTMPLDAWFAGEWGRFLEATVRESDVFDRKTVEALLAGQRRGRVGAHRIYALAFFELWRREYKATL